MRTSKSLFFLSLFTLILSLSPAQAGVFNIPHFVDPGAFALGVEVELSLVDNDAGMAGNLKYTHGISDLINVGGVIGTGGGVQQFRIGTIGVFDLFPDAEDQPGIGLGASAIYYRLKRDRGQLQTILYPYIHKSFVSGDSEFDPFISIPFGLAIQDGSDLGLWWIAIGSRFEVSEHFHVIVELGAPIDNTDTYISGGMAYYY